MYATPGTHRVQERECVLELQVAVSCHANAEALPLKEPSVLLTAERPLSLYSVIFKKADYMVSVLWNVYVVDLHVPSKPGVLVLR